MPEQNNQSTPVTVELPVGTPVTACTMFDKRQEVPCAYDGQIERPGNRGTLISESGYILFYSPSSDKCISNQHDRLYTDECTLKVELDLPSIIKDSFFKDPKNKIFVETLTKNFSNELAQYRPESTKSMLPEKSQSEKDTNQVAPGGEWVLIGSISLIALAAITGIYVYINRSTKKTQRTRSQARVVTPGNLFTSQNAGAISLSSADQLRSLNASINRLVGKIDAIENEILGLNQRLSQLETKNISSTKQRVGMAVVNTSESYNAPAPVPKPVTQDLIKKALLSNDYQSIRHADHIFVSETLESQKGLPTKVFSVDGTREQADLCSQSEFIAVYIEGSCYLIPNILPNAANPSRTIKRHADLNNIYSHGGGSNMQDLTELPLVEKSGNTFKLVSKGQIR